MTEKIIPLTVNVPIGKDKPYKVVKMLKLTIDKVTKNYSYDNVYLNEVDNKPHFAVVFKFYSQKEIDDVNKMFKTLTSMLNK